MHKHLTAAVFVLVLALTGIAAAQEKSIQSDNALAYLTLDIENSRGWVAKVKGGYQWKLFRNVGIEVSDGIDTVGHKKNFTKDGATGSVSLGYNFGERFPLTVGLQFGMGPSGKMSQRTAAGPGGVGTLYSHQKVSIYVLDLTADYDFRNCSRWTPFVGVTAGAAFVSQRGHAELSGPGDSLSGSMGKRRSVNFMTGARAGVKYDINDRLTLSLYGSYNYLGKVKSKEYDLTGGGNSLNARTSKITAHSVDVKAGLTLRF